MINRAFTFCLTTLPLLFLVSCAGNSTQTQVQSTQDKQAELCTNLARFNTSVATLKSMSPSSTVGDFRAAREQVKTAFADVKTSAQAVQGAKLADLEQAYQQLDTAVSSVPDSATLNQAAQSIAPSIAAVEAAQTQTRSGLNCP